jgi:hypothetical protein
MQHIKKYLLHYQQRIRSKNDGKNRIPEHRDYTRTAP